MAYTTTYHEDSDADDEYERSVITSPTLPPDFEGSSPTSSGPPSTEHTPTTFTHSRDSHGSPTGLISQWSAEQCADFISSLGLTHYAETFVDEGITGDALIALQHAELKEMGLTSVGHRLTILKAVYEIKVKQNVAIEPDHYIPLSADTTVQDVAPTQDDIARIIHIIQARDERIHIAESELRHLKDDLNRVAEENRKLREEVLPLVRMAKDRSQPLPTPDDHLTALASPPPPEPSRAGSSLSRKFSTKKLFLGSAPKNPSPTIHENQTLVDNSSLNPSAAAMAASSHLTASMTGQSVMSPSQPPQPSPTSPAYSTLNQNSARSFNRSDMPRSAHPDHEPTLNWPNSSTWSAGSTIVGDRDTLRNPTPAPLSSRPMRSATTPAPDADREPPLSANSLNTSTSTLQSSTPSSATATSSNNPQVEIFKSFRVSIDDPCHKVLPVALKKYNITADWRQYALYIVHGDQERCLGLNERPLILFKQLDKEGRKPMFMLRKHAAPVEGHVSTVGSGQQMPVQAGSGGGGGFGWDGGSRGAVQLPGGVL
ncbi:RA-domain-containing protein [Mytilinidion resinicola]|uniref:RA-domain-containing protein n=1 Tax=Mytilinidion resinicola TaxID=574789 RepID=A0A6A6YJP5_9PEZI|nr:RA-domain-containing protein [Mytilinidion resinicola]KAF2809086.1 RA-domain-containing protein [Mytilinidion resinicola]